MCILKDISKARLEFVKTHGRRPRRMVVSPLTLDKIKNKLYRNSPIDPKEIPLTKYDGMTIEVGEPEDGWTISGS